MASTVVADIGGTSSRWGVLSAEGALILDGLPGFNPAVGEPGAFILAVKERFLAQGIEVGDLYAYGAGCGSLDRSTRMAETLLLAFPGARVDVASDLLGTAHGLLGSATGLVLILGTGMNAGYYDGTALHQPMPSLGYILGDEGSGADIGKHFLQDALHGRVPDALMRAVFPHGIDVAKVIERLYRGSGPQSWLASFAGTIAEQVEEGYVTELVASRFRELSGSLQRYFGGTSSTNIYATGSVAYGYKGILENVLREAGFNLSDVQPSPLPGLLRYRAPAAH